MRTTKSLLNSLCLHVNRVTCSPVEYYHERDGKCIISVGHYHIEYSGGGAQFVRTKNDTGGVTNVFRVGHRTNREVADLISAFIEGAAAYAGRDKIVGENYKGEGGTKPIVKQQSGSDRYGVYVNGELIEGGFFTLAAAADCAWDYNNEIRAGRKQ
jgi:hypothetical protein